MAGLPAGLCRWTSFHPEWKEAVGSVAVETPDGLVLIDPIDPPDDLTRPDHVGDVLLDAGARPKATAEPLRLCPTRWLQGATQRRAPRRPSPAARPPRRARARLARGAGRGRRREALGRVLAR